MQGAFLLLSPCVPAEWSGFEIVFRYRSTRYEIVVENPHSTSGGAIAHATLDGKVLPSGQTRVPLLDDGRTHAVRAILA